MIERFTQESLTWVNIKQPTQEEVHEVMDEFDIPPAFMSDLMVQVPRSDAILNGKVIRITLDFPIVRRTDIDHPHEIKFIIAKNYLITAHYEDMEALDRFKKEFEVLTTLRKTNKKNTGAHIFIALLGTLYSVSSSKLDYLESKLNDIEVEIFREHEKQMVFEISSVSKKLISFRQTLRPHEEVFRAALPLFESVYKKTVQEEMQRAHGQYFFVLRRTASLLEMLDDLRETNMALLTTKQNEVMKILTIMAFITFPLTLITSVFGMNTDDTPIVGQAHDFWIIFGIMGLATVGFFTFFKYKKWI